MSTRYKKVKSWLRYNFKEEMTFLLLFNIYVVAVNISMSLPYELCAGC